jgi:FKBP-type peptidyl-prolyl cis-trans isomerase 2
MSRANAGDTVKVHYTGTFADGTQFDSSRGREPLEVKLGAGQVIPGFDEALTGMSVGDTKTVTIPADQAYGARREEMVQQVPRSAIPADIELAGGLRLSAQGPNGQTFNFVVASFDDQQVTLDGNHPLAGRDLTFDLELVSVA